jgi:hypothetical protein
MFRTLTPLMRRMHCCEQRFFSVHLLLLLLLLAIALLATRVNGEDAARTPGGNDNAATTTTTTCALLKRKWKARCGVAAWSVRTPSPSPLPNLRCARAFLAFHVPACATTQTPTTPAEVANYVVGGDAFATACSRALALAAAAATGDTDGGPLATAPQPLPPVASALPLSLPPKKKKHAKTADAWTRVEDPTAAAVYWYNNDTGAVSATRPGRFNHVCFCQ